MKYIRSVSFPAVSLIVLLCSIVFSSYCIAASCSVSSSEFQINAGSITVQQNIPVGAIISNQISAGQQTLYICNNAYGATIGAKSYLQISPVKISGVTIFTSNVPGVGIEFGGLGVAARGGYSYAASCYIGSGTDCNSSLAYGEDYQFIERIYSTTLASETLAFGPFITLVKIGDVQNGVLSGPIGTVIAGVTNSKGQIISDLPEIPVNFAGGTINVIACSVSSTNLAFSMGNVPVNQFTGVGTVSQQTSTENLGLNCDSVTNINVTMQGTQSSDTTDDSVLALTPGSGSVATGVGVQLLYNGNPLEINKLLNLKSSASGVETFPITARYIQTKSAVTAGTANATAVLDITYQ